MVPTIKIKMVIDKMEKVQSRATTLILDIRNDSYNKRLMDLDLIRIVN